MATALEPKPSKTMTRVEELDAKMAEIRAMMDRIPLAIVEMLATVPDEKAASPVLKSFDLSGAMEYIANCSNIIVMTGAGISTSAGIPDFRTPGTGLYSQLEKYNLPNPESIFTLEFFRDNPKPFFSSTKELYRNNFEPTIAHHFIRLLNEKGKLLRIYTQNVDSLERIAGVPSEKIVEAHGTLITGHCLNCQKEYSLGYIKEIIFKDEIPYCEDCSNIIKPDIVFFGENLPERFNECVSSDFPQCDFLLIMGTSLQVAPFNMLISRVNKTCPRVLINIEPAGNFIPQWDPFLDLLKFDSKKNSRDVFHKSNCDDGAIEMVKLLGWQNEFDQLLGKKVLCRSVNTSAQKSIVGTKKKINSKPEKVQTTVTSAPRHTSLPKQTSPNKSSSSTKSTMNKTGQKRQ